MRKVLFLFFSFCCLISSAQISFQKLYGGIKDETNECLSYNTGILNLTDNNGYIMCHSTLSYASPNKQGIYVLKLDQFGDTTFTNTFYLSNDQTYGRSICQTSDGGYLIGFSNSTLIGSGLIKLNSSGNLVWSKTYSGMSGNYLTGAKGLLLKNGNFLFAGANGGSIGLCKTDPNGNVIYGVRYSLAPFSNDQIYIRSCYECSNGDIVSTGFKKYGAFLYDILLMRTDSMGNLKFAKTYGYDNFADTGYGITELSDSSLMVVAQKDTNSFYKINLLKTDKNGNPLFLKGIYNSDSQWCNNVIHDNQDNIYFCGVAQYTANLAGALLVKCDPFGNILLSRIFKNGQYGNSVYITPDKGIVMGGMGANGANMDCFLIKTDSTLTQGCDIQNYTTSAHTQTFGITNATFVINNDIVANNITFLTKKGTNITTKCQNFPTTSLLSNEADEHFSLYPNPAENHLVLKTNSFITNAQVTITNTFGQIVLNEKDVDVSTLKINTASLLPGLYLIEVRSKTKCLKSKFVKE